MSRLKDYLVFVCLSKTERREAKETALESTVCAAPDGPADCACPFSIFRRRTSTMTNIVNEITRLEIASQDNPMLNPQATV